MATCKACQNTYPSGHGLADHAVVCARVRSKRPQWWEREPGYLHLEVAAERSKPATVPAHTWGGHLDCMDKRTWASVWRDTYALAHPDRELVTYGERDLFLDSLKALHWEW